MPELSFRLVLVTDDAKAKLSSVTQEAETAKGQIEKPVAVKITAGEALATIRDVKLAFDGVMQVVSSVVNTMNGYLDEALAARQSQKLATLAFHEGAAEMSNYAQQMQGLTNVEGDALLALMAKLSMTYKLNTTDIKLLTPALLDFAEANKATGMTVETAFDLMGRAVNGHTEMLGRYGIELDDTRLKTEGVSYLVEKLSADYGGTAIALADLRTQNKNAWGDVKESIGDMINTALTPLLKLLNNVMEAYNNLNPTVKGFVTGLAVAIPVVTAGATAIITMTAAVTALKIAINPVVGIISAAVTVLSALGFAYAASKIANDGAKDSQGAYKKTVEATTESTEQLIEKNRQIAGSIDYEEAKRRIKEIQKAYKETADTMTEADWEKAELERIELVKVVAREDAKAVKDFNKEKIRIETESHLSGIALLEYKLAYTKQTYKDLGAVTASNVAEQKSQLAEIANLEKQIATETAQTSKDSTDKQKQLTQDKFKSDVEYYANLKDVGISSYGAMKKTMADYYAWAKKNLPKEEADLILQQMRETNLQWGQRRAAELQKEYAHQQEMAGVRDDFHKKDLEQNNDTYALQIIAIEEYYASRADKMRQAGISEADIERQKNKAILALNITSAQQMVGGVSSILGNLANSADKESKKGFAVWKGLALAQASVDMLASAMGAFKSVVSIPVIGPALAPIAAAAAVAAGLANISKIQATEYKKAEKGGLLKGNSHRDGGIIIEAEDGEYVTASQRVRALGRNIFDFLNFAPIGQVKMAFAGMPIPSVPMNATPAGFYAQGGNVSGGGMGSLFEALITEIKSLRAEVRDNRPIINVEVDPLSNNPVKLYQISEAGRVQVSEL